METPTDLRIILSRELGTEELNLGDDTVVISAEVSRRVIDALRGRGEEESDPAPAGN